MRRLARIYECLPLLCPQCGEPMRIIAFILDRSVIERILGHIGEPVTAPEVLPARSPPQAEMDFDQPAGRFRIRTGYQRVYFGLGEAF